MEKEFEELKPEYTGLVFLSFVISAMILAIAEATTAGDVYELFALIRIPIGFYIVFFPTGFLLLSFLFPSKEMHFLERISLSIAASVSAVTISILFFSIALHLPITLEYNLLVISILNVILFALYLSRKILSPWIEKVSQKYEVYSSTEKTFSQKFGADIAYFASLIALLIAFYARFASPDKVFVSVSNVLSTPLLAFIALFPTGYIAYHFLLEERLKEGKLKAFESLVFSFAISITAFVAIYFLSPIFYQFTSMLFPAAGMIVLSSFLYIGFNVKNRIIPLIKKVFR